LVAWTTEAKKVKIVLGIIVMGEKREKKEKVEEREREKEEKKKGEIRVKRETP